MTGSKVSRELVLRDTAREEPNAVGTRTSNKIKDMAAQIALEGTEANGKWNCVPRPAEK
jgi:hypothetical protein